MSDPDPPRAPPLTLPPSVALSSPPDRDPHPDSEEFVQQERHRIAQELEPVRSVSSDLWPTSGLHLESNAPSARSRSPLSTSNRTSISHDASRASTVTDSEGPGTHHERRYRLRRQVPHWYDPIAKFWTSQISVAIDEGSHRDHLALERTFLGYLRTSLAFAMTGVIIAQLFRLQHSVNPNLRLGFFVLGIPLAAIFIGFGAIVLLVGAFRFWRQQNAMIRGKVHRGGLEISMVMLGSIVISMVVFVLLVVVDIDKSYN